MEEIYIFRSLTEGSLKYNIFRGLEERSLKYSILRSLACRA